MVFHETQRGTDAIFNPLGPQVVEQRLDVRMRLLRYLGRLTVSGQGSLKEWNRLYVSLPEN
jgi:hypothetical protein